MKAITSLFFALISGWMLHASHPVEAIPRSKFGTPLAANASSLTLQKPDYAPLMALRAKSKLKNELIPSATVVFASVSPNTHGTWIKTEDGYRVWQLELHLPSAFGSALYYEKFKLPKGSLLFVSTGKKRYAFDHTTNPDGKHFSTPVLSGERCLIEINILPGITELPEIQMEGAAWFFMNEGLNIPTAQNPSRGFGDAGDCQININCKEGDDWQGEKRAVVRILTRVGSSAGWCTGTIMNNTFQDCTPYILTADHCRSMDGVQSTESDFDQYQFYFGYEAPDCSKPKETDVPVGSITGATFKAGSTSSGDTDSDFLLLELKTPIPSFYNPVFAGWYNQNVSSSSGVMIHHPAGDIKKISTYKQPTQSSTWGNKVMNTHWKVRWMTTDNGKGVSEGGSSGSPLFNDYGYVVGHLTGGNTSCVDSGGFSPNGYDLFGKFSYSFLWHDDNSAENLFAWLDKGNSHLMFLPSIAWPCNELPTTDEAEVKAVEKTIMVYPNPSRNLVHIDLAKPEAVREIKISDMQGRLIQTLPVLTQQTLVADNFSQGVYLLLITYTDSSTKVQKIVIDR